MALIFCKRNKLYVCSVLTDMLVPDLVRGIVLAFTIGLFMWPGVAEAQTTGGVFGPVVNPGDRTAEYRFAYDYASNAWAQRVHYQQALNGDVSARLIVQSGKRANGDFDFQFLQAELLWQISPDGWKWQTGLRLDGRISKSGEPGQIGLNWTNQFKLSQSVQARVVVLSSVEVGNNKRNGLFLQSRGQISWAAPNVGRLGVELFSSYGSISNLRPVRNQVHQLGPTITFPFKDGWQVFVGHLVGMTSASADQVSRVWISRSF